MSEKQCLEFRALFPGESLGLFQRAMDGKLRDSPLRGLSWRFFLGALSGPQSGWIELVRAQQVEFDVLCHKHCVDPSAVVDDEVDLSISNPLSTAAESPFNKFFASSAMREQINQDLERLQPGDAFFARRDVQRMMHRILFVWASSHAEISYRQGMHELLAPLLMVNLLEAEEASAAANAPKPEPPTPPPAAVPAQLPQLVGVGDALPFAVDPQEEDEEQADPVRSLLVSGTCLPRGGTWHRAQTRDALRRLPG